jgi:hypothetical protein
MSNPEQTRLTIAELVPTIYEDAIKRWKMHPSTDLSRSGKCSQLTIDLAIKLWKLDLPHRRELHRLPEEPNYFHFVIAHSQDDPTPQDAITSMNPWGYEDGDRFTGHLHGPRDWVRQVLHDAGAPEQFVAIHGIETIVKPHTMELDVISQYHSNFRP